MNSCSVLQRHLRRQIRSGGELSPSHTKIIRRHLASSPRPFSSLEYPTRNEAPIITRSTAKDFVDDDTTSIPSKSAPSSKELLDNVHDPFDEDQSLTALERQAIRDTQRSDLNITLSPLVQPIHSTKPLYIPPNAPQDSLETPETQLTTLDNGLRIASQETYGQCTTFGIISNCGSRYESSQSQTTGVNYLLELLAFRGTSQLSTPEAFQETLDSLGCAFFANSSREQFLYCMDVLRPNVKPSFELLRQALLEPRLLEHELEDVKKIVEYQWMDIMPEVRLSEALHVAAYGQLDGQVQQLGRPHVCSLEALPSLNIDTIREFRNQHLLNPKEMVIAAAGIQHDELVDLVNESFGHLESPSSSGNKSPIIHSTYTGGEVRQTIPTTDGFTRIALAFPTGGWHSDDLVPTCVLQTLLGGGSAFSAGGPGKGMYSRLYRYVLNRYHFESCEAFTNFYSESGLLGISGSATPQHSGDMAKILAEHFARLAIDLVEDEEFDRARNMLKCNVLTQLEGRLVLFEDIGRQISTFGKREGTEEMCRKIDEVTKEDLRRIVRQSICGDGSSSGNDSYFSSQTNHPKPTLSVVGDVTDNVPSVDEISRWFSSL